MKKAPFSIAILMFVSILDCQRTTCFAQGSLTPPGAPGVTMKSLAQIEPRTPISSAPFNIAQPGSYYLTTNLIVPSGNGINIQTNNVTLDLNGFSLIGNVSGYGINFSNAQTNVVIRNGSLSGWNEGVVDAWTTARSIVVERLTVSECITYGIYSSGQMLLRDCLSVSNRSYGIYNSGNGEIINCESSYNAFTGILAFNCLVKNCRVSNNGNATTGGYGIEARPATVTGCLAQNNVQSGIFVNAPGSYITGNTCIGNNTSANSFNAGIYVNDSNNRIEENHVTASGYAGISCSSSYFGNIIIKNSVFGNGGNNYLTPNLQIIGPLISTYNTITNSNPWANFSY